MPDRDGLRRFLQERHSELRRRMVDEKLDAVVTTSFESLGYLAGVWEPGFQWIPNRRGLVVVTADSVDAIVSSYTEPLLIADSPTIPVSAYSAEGDAESPWDVLQKVLGHLLPGSTVGVEMDRLSARGLEHAESALHRFSLIDISGILRRQRSVKDAYELEQIRTIAQICTDASALAVRNSAVGDRELAFAATISEYCSLSGASEGFIVLGSGARSAEAHPAATGRETGTGELMRTDVIMRSTSGYIGDIGRTMSIGEPTKLDMETTELLWMGIEAATASLTEGSPLSAAYRACSEVFESHGQAMAISHVGHSIGLELHERPMLTQAATGMVQSGMTFCVEAVIPAVRMGVPVWYHFEQLVEVADGKPKRVAGPTPFEILSIRG